MPETAGEADTAGVARKRRVRFRRAVVRNILTGGYGTRARGGEKGGRKRVYAGSEGSDNTAKATAEVWAADVSKVQGGGRSGAGAGMEQLIKEDGSSERDKGLSTCASQDERRKLQWPVCFDSDHSPIIYFISNEIADPRDQGVALNHRMHEDSFCSRSTLFG